MVNGQSGRVQGERPWSIWKLTGAVLAALIVLAAVVFLAERSGYVEFSSSGRDTFPSGSDYIIQGY